MYILIGRKWFDKTYGNTYHTVNVYNGNVHLYHSPVQYGYGEQWLQTAFKILKSHNRFRQCKTYWEFCLYIRENPNKVFHYSHDVSTKKEL
jgi:hypothetical protein